MFNQLPQDMVGELVAQQISVMSGAMMAKVLNNADNKVIGEEDEAYYVTTLVKMSKIRGHLRILLARLCDKWEHLEADQNYLRQ